jgi:hypothetical protein
MSYPQQSSRPYVVGSCGPLEYDEYVAISCNRLGACGRFSVVCGRLKLPPEPGTFEIGDVVVF